MVFFRSGSGQSYRIGYARLVNGINWILDLKNSEIDISTSGWDSEMIEYPFVVIMMDLDICFTMEMVM